MSALTRDERLRMLTAHDWDAMVAWCPNSPEGHQWWGSDFDDSNADYKENRARFLAQFTAMLLDSQDEIIVALRDRAEQAEARVSGRDTTIKELGKVIDDWKTKYYESQESLIDKEARVKELEKSRSEIISNYRMLDRQMEQFPEEKTEC